MATNTKNKTNGLSLVPATSTDAVIVTGEDGRQYSVPSEALRPLQEDERDYYLRELHLDSKAALEGAKVSFDQFVAMVGLGKQARREMHGGGLGRIASKWRNWRDQRNIYGPALDELLREVMIGVRGFAANDREYWNNVRQAPVMEQWAQNRALVTVIDRSTDRRMREEDGYADARVMDAAMGVRGRHEEAAMRLNHHHQMEVLHAGFQQEQSLRLMDAMQAFIELETRLRMLTSGEHTRMILDGAQKAMAQVQAHIDEQIASGLTPRDVKDLQPMYQRVFQDAMDTLEREAKRTLPPGQ